MQERHKIIFLCLQRSAQWNRCVLIL